MADDLAAAVGALRRAFVNRALEAVERVALPARRQLERFVVVVTADVAFRHRREPPAMAIAKRSPGELSVMDRRPTRSCPESAGTRRPTGLCMSWSFLAWYRGRSTSPPRRSSRRRRPSTGRSAHRHRAP